LVFADFLDSAETVDFMEEDTKTFSLPKHGSVSGSVNVTSTGVKYCSDGKRCDRESCEVVSPLGVVMVCSRMRHSPRTCFTKAKNRSVCV